MGGKWSTAGVPHRGWTCEDWIDLGEPSAICEMCESMPIRYTHVMTHPDYPHTLSCGCHCAGQMEGSYAAARGRDSKMKLRAARRARFPRRKGWRRAGTGTLRLKVDGHTVLVFRKEGGFRFGIVAPDEYQPTWGRKSYPTEAEAQLAAFDALEDALDAREYWDWDA